MGFGQKGTQSIATNFQSKRTVIGLCGTSGDIRCTTSLIVPTTDTNTTTDTNSDTSTLTSIELVSNNNSNNNNIYNISNSLSYIYLFNFSGTFYGSFNTTITLTDTNNTATFNFTYNTIQPPITPSEYAIPILTSSSITTSQQSGAYYTINPGTYSMVINTNPEIKNTLTFSSVTISNNIPSQTVKIYPKNIS
jgi:hypothetical protein